MPAGSVRRRSKRSTWGQIARLPERAHAAGVAAPFSETGRRPTDGVQSELAYLVVRFLFAGKEELFERAVGPTFDQVELSLRAHYRRERARLGDGQLCDLPEGDDLAAGLQFFADRGTDLV